MRRSLGAERLSTGCEFGVARPAEPLDQEDRRGESAHAPYGQAAVAAMQREGIYDRVKNKCVLGENISQAASFVVSGAADVGIVALSLALSPNMKDNGRYVEIPAAEYPPIEQACVILKSSKNKETAKQFLSFVKTAAIAETLRRYGFDVQYRRAMTTPNVFVGTRVVPVQDACGLRDGRKGCVLAIPQVGGLHHRYQRRAA